MCGIAGFCREGPGRAEVIRAMTDRMRHRGPDAEGFWLDEHSGWTLGHRRLAVIDLSETGAQPMLSASGRFVLSYNGEIYNAPALREKLVGERGTVFRGTSDTEVLLEAIEAWGLEETLRRCRGMFALAVYDRQERTLRLARDRAGEKPLYYGMVPSDGGAYFAFASDCALFRCLPGFNGELDRDALAAFMLYKFIPAPMSVYRGIRKLPPGHILTLRAPFTEPELREYWSMTETALRGQAEPFRGSLEEAADRLESLLTESIRGQMVADVPVGAFLSGGIDSPLVVSLMQKLSDRPVRTFTIGYDDPRIDESDAARDIARHLGTEHTELILTEREMKELIPELPYYFTEPLGDSSLISTFFVSRLARTQVTVSLSGDAGDELFCGYERYWESEALWRKLGRVPGFVRRPAGALIEAAGLARRPFFYKAASCLRAGNVNQIKSMIQYRRDMESLRIVAGGTIRPLREVEARMEDDCASMQLFDLAHYFPDDILYKVDRAAMAHSLETRIPMLDRDFVEFAWTLPPEFRYSGGVSKRILREVLYRHVPREMLERPKQGFYVPVRKWLMEGSTYEYASELFEHSRLAEDGWIDGGIVRDTWAFFQEHRKKDHLLFNVLMAEQWYRSQLGV